MADEDRDLDAAERALGLLPPGPETPSERTAREKWELRLAVLADGIAPVAPPAGLLERVERRIDAGERDEAEARIARLARARRRWRTAALASMAVAAGLAALVLVPLLSPPAPVRYVAVVHAADDPTAAGMIVQIDPAAGTAVVIPVLERAPDGASYEMWQIRQGTERPVSIGLLPVGPRISPRLEAAPGDVFAISLEPEGGSPTGAPTQALYIGRVVAVSGQGDPPSE